MNQLELKDHLIVYNNIHNRKFVIVTPVCFSFWRKLLHGIKCSLYALDDSNFAGIDWHIRQTIDK